MGVKYGFDVFGEQFKVFLRHAVAPLGYSMSILYEKNDFLVNLSNHTDERCFFSILPVLV